MKDHTTMTTTENSRADALTDEQILAIAHRSGSIRMMPSRFLIGFAREILAASPVEQPAAAPIHPDDEAVDRFSIAMKAKLAEARASWADEIIGDLQESFDTEGITENDSGDALIRLSSAIAAVEEAAQARAASATKPADERTAFAPSDDQWEQLRLLARTYNEVGFPKYAREWLARATSSIAPDDGRCYAPACGKWDGNDTCTCARAASANETGVKGAADIEERAHLAAGQWANSNTPIAEALAYRDGFIAGARSRAMAAEAVAQWQYSVITPGYEGDWHNCNAETAQRLQQPDLADFHKVRPLYTAPQPAQASSIIEAIAAQWDDCTYDSPGGDIEIGAAIRAAWKRLSGAPAQADARVGLTDERILALWNEHYLMGPRWQQHVLTFARALLQGANQ